jgi:two-component system, chemotaxis family, sensor kinase CheA
MNLDEILQTFIVESRELLESMEQALLQLEQAPADAELLNAIFRAAHTIKGSAGLFGLEHLVAFTHHAENVLDQVRGGEVQLSRDLVALLLQVRDHLAVLIDHIEAGTTPDAGVHAQSHQLMQALQACSPSAAPESLAAAVPAPASPKAAIPQMPLDGLPAAATSDWHISLYAGPDLLRDGMEPLALLHCLASMGRIVGLATISHALPDVADMDPETCYLGFALRYQSDLSAQAIEGIFEFVRDCAQVCILPPHSPLQQYRQALPPEQNQSHAHAAWMQALQDCGSLTAQELALLWPSPSQPQPAATSAPATPTPAAPASPVPAALKAPAAPAAKTTETAVIRVQADTLDAHINLIGELIIASAGLHLAVTSSGLPQLQEAASVVARLVESVRGSALQLRMVQIGATFNKFQRVVREVSQEIGKDIALDISGADTELDKTVIEKIGDPLTHLVRNAIDHGIEPVAVRVARGKPAQGRVRLHACHDAGSILIEVSDDGGGLSSERILAKALERGLVRPDQTLSAHDIQQLIFEPGFSTAEQVNNLSGRGVGMDVVRRNIAALRGSIEIQSAEGQGTRIRIRLPLTLAIIDGFLVTVGDSSLVIPLDMVQECIELTPETAQQTKGHDVFPLRDELLPMIGLRQLFGLPELSSVAVEPEPQARENLVVVRCGEQRAGLLVDALQGEYQTVIRPLGPVFHGLPGMSGFTILGTGRVALIVDVPQLLATVASRHTLSDGAAPVQHDAITA